MNAGPLVDGLPLAHIAAALRSTNRFTAGVRPDRPWRYVPHRAWVYRVQIEFEDESPGLWAPNQQIGIEACAPFKIHTDESSDFEAVSSELAALLEEAIWREPDRGMGNADTRMRGWLPHEVPEKASGTGGPLLRVVMLIEVGDYSRTAGNPYGTEARRGG